jgi:hypothetical protein
LQGLLLLAYWHPEAALHESFVHTLPSSQLTDAPPQVPPAQVSLVVQAFPSSQGLELLAWAQPVSGSQKSFVQAFPSPQTGGGPPTQTPPEQTSPVVQALPSLHALVLLVNTQPCAALQVSVVHSFPSLQVGGGPPTHIPPEQVSFVVQALPSLQALALLTCTQPVAGLQESSVQPLPSSQLGGAPGTQAPPEQTSPTVQALPSLQAAELLVKTQTPPWHVSVVHGLPSLHGFAGHSMQPPIGVPPQAPPAQISPVVHA